MFQLKYLIRITKNRVGNTLYVISQENGNYNFTGNSFIFFIGKIRKYFFFFNFSIKQHLTIVQKTGTHALTMTKSTSLLSAAEMVSIFHLGRFYKVFTSLSSSLSKKYSARKFLNFYCR